MAMLLELVVDMENPFGCLKEKLIPICIGEYLPNLKMPFSVVCCYAVARDSFIFLKGFVADCLWLS